MKDAWQEPGIAVRTMGEDMFPEEEKAAAVRAAVPSYRPILYIGLGGIGCRVVTGLKEAARDLPEEARRRMAFMGMDTHGPTEYEVLGRNNYVSLGLGIDPQVAARDDMKRLGWYEEVRGGYEAPMVSAGAGKVRAVGRLAFLHGPTLGEFLRVLEGHLRGLMQGIARGTVQPKVYIISSIAGGTGAGCLLDVFFFVRRRVGQQIGGTVKVQAILVSPEVVLSEAPPTDPPDFYANAYSVLKELMHLHSGSAHGEVYPSPMENVGEPFIRRSDLPDPLYLVTGINHHGTVVAARKATMVDMIVEYLLAEVRTLVRTPGDPKVQDRENPAIGQPGHRNMPRMFSSFGLVRIGVPIALLGQIVALKLLEETIEAETAVESCLPTVRQWVTAWIDRNDLAEDGSDRLQMAIRQDDAGNLFSVVVDVAGTVLKRPYDKMQAQCRQDMDDHLAGLGEQYLGAMQSSARRILDRAWEEFEAQFVSLYSQETLGAAVRLLREAGDELTQHVRSIEEELRRGLEELDRLRSGTLEAVGLVGQSAGAGFFTRGRMTRDAVALFQETLQNLLSRQLDVWSMEEAKGVYAALQDRLAKKASEWDRLAHLAARVRMAKQTRFDLVRRLNEAADFDRRGRGNFVSLMDASHLEDLYGEWVGSDRVQSMVRRAREAWRKSGLLLSVEGETDWLRKAVNQVEGQVREALSPLGCRQAIDRYYKDEGSRRGLFDRLVTLGSSLYPVHANAKETAYETQWVVAAHPSLHADMEELCRKHFARADGGLNLAHADDVYEVGFYSITHGFTPHSLTRVPEYQANYDRRQAGYMASLSGRGAIVPPAHSWLGADAWREVTPRSDEDEETLKWFGLGRAFSRLFPSARTATGEPDDKKNRAYLYRRGSYYYVNFPEKKGKKIVPAEICLGQSLAEAVRRLQLSPHIQEFIQKEVEREIHTRGAADIRQRLLEEYLPELTEEIATAKRTKGPKGGADLERARLLAEMKATLEEFVEVNLRVEGV